MMVIFSINRASMVLSVIMAGLYGSYGMAQEGFKDRVIGNWMLTCSDGPCRAFFNVQQGGDIVVTWTLIFDPERHEHSSLVKVPTGVAIPPGLRIYADDAVFFDAPFQVCEPDGCTAIYSMDKEMLDIMQGKTTMRVAFIRYGEAETIAYEVPTDRMTEAFEALR